jgi:hypothetical protein
MSEPPLDIELAMRGLCLALNRDNCDWQMSRTVIGYYFDGVDDRPFREKIKGIDVAQIPHYAGVRLATVIKHKNFGVSNLEESLRESREEKVLMLSRSVCP